MIKYPPVCENLEASKYPTPKAPESKYYEYENTQLRNNAVPEWGVALSGGGIRSALFSIGALKGLYDGQGPKFFADVDYISSVSGGGYASYWLYNNELESSKPFGFETLGARYAHTVNQVRNNNGGCRMYPSYRMLAQVFTSRAVTHRDYGRQIDKRFGNGNPESHKVTFGDLERIVRKRRLPVPIVNTTISAKKTNPSAYRNFEFSPTQMGNPEIGSDRYSIKQFRFNEAVAISGAAFGLLQHEYVKKVPPSGAKKSWVLSDGGHNENLGVLPLVRRGVRNIIVFDGEHSPDYKFEAVDQLRRNLCDIGCKFISIEIDKIKGRGYTDRFKPIPSGVFEGEITGKGIQDIRVLYVKMSYNKDLRDEVVKDLKKTHPHRMPDEPKILCDWLGNAADDPKGKYKFIKHTQLSDPKSCMKLVRSYSKYLNHNSFWSRTTCLGFGAYNFPHMSTGDQSYRFDDQLGATLALGYLQGRQLSNKMKTQH